MDREAPKEIAAILGTDEPERVMREAVQEAIRRHKLPDLPIAVSRAGKSCGSRRRRSRCHLRATTAPADF